jgi:hypothetical protein
MPDRIAVCWNVRMNAWMLLGMAALWMGAGALLATRLAGRILPAAAARTAGGVWALAFAITFAGWLWARQG